MKMKLFIYAICFEPRVEIREYIYEKAVVYKDCRLKKYMLDPLVYLEELHSAEWFFYSLKKLKTNELMKIKKRIYTGVIVK